MDESIKGKAIFGFIWRFLQNAGTQIISFIISIVLARVLMPEDYGLVAMITVFTNIAMVEGMVTMELAKIIGITPVMLTLMGRVDD